MKQNKRIKDCGVLLHISSLPSSYGIGNLGQSAYDFVDFLHVAGQTYWQILPIGPTAYGDSPYQSPSAFAGNPYFIDLDALVREGLLTAREAAEARSDTPTADYGKLFAERETTLRKAFARFEGERDTGYAAFCRENAYWLDAYALFCAVKEHFGLRPHWEWPQEYRHIDSMQVRSFAAAYAHAMEFVRFTQYVFDVQWRRLAAYARSRGIRIIGDVPIYAAYDSADFWENPARFSVDADGKPTEVAGVPPDYFSADGQLWGNPLYNWEQMQADGYSFWIDRIRRAFSLFDVLRIDHFRGFESYYAVPSGRRDAREGVWRQGPGKSLFDAVEAALGRKNIIAEDLGVDSEGVRALVRDCGFPGMKVVQFGFDGDARYNAHALRNFTYDAVGYTGTHDNDTALGWFTALPPHMRKRVRDRLPREKTVRRAVICALYGSRVRTAIVPMQDWLGQGSEARMNTPGVSSGNWAYRLAVVPSAALAAEMRELAVRYGRAECTDAEM